jgi:tetratricopeptide (TPR) repeat protein
MLQQNKIGRYVPVSSALHVLQLIPLSQRVLDIENDILSGKVKRDDLKRILQQRSTSPSNLELYIWAKRLNEVLKRTPNLLSAIRPLLHCPILPALYERALPDAMQQLASFAEETDKATSNLFYSRMQYRLGHDFTPLAFANAAYSSFQRVGDPKGEGEALVVRGSIEEHSNFLDAAEKSFKAAGKLAETDSLRAEALQGLGRTESRLGRDKSAKSHFLQSSELFQQRRDLIGEFAALNGIADVEKKEGQYAAAEEELNKAISVVHSVGNTSLEAEAWYKLGTVQMQVGDNADAVTSFSRVVSLEPPSTPLVIDSTKFLSVQQVVPDAPKSD